MVVCTAPNRGNAPVPALKLMYEKENASMTTTVSDTN
jgi:hypothetical protein